jgi:hypothetical protein
VRIIALAIVGVFLALGIIGAALLLYVWLNKRVLKSLDKQTVQIREKAAHSLEEALAIDDLVHYLTDEQRKEYRAQLDKYKGNQ